MSLPAAVPSNSTNTGEATITVPTAGAGANVKLTTQVVVNNLGGSTALVNAYVVLDLNGSSTVLADALPLYFPPGQSRQEFTTFLTGLAAGNHTLDLYLYTNVANVNWVWTRFLGTIYLA